MTDRCNANASLLLAGAAQICTVGLYERGAAQPRSPAAAAGQHQRICIRADGKGGCLVLTFGGQLSTQP